MYYLDTSVIVALLTPEVNSYRAERWVHDHPASLAISAWVETEVASAMSMKVRSGTLSADERTQVLTAWTTLVSSLTLLPLHRSHFTQAALLANNHASRLRAGDALHAAVAAASECSLVTFDHILASAYDGLGRDVASI